MSNALKKMNAPKRKKESDSDSSDFGVKKHAAKKREHTIPFSN